MASRKPADIKNATTQALMEQGDALLEDGRNKDAVEKFGEAYLWLLRQSSELRVALGQVLEHPQVKEGVSKGITRNAPWMFPRYGAKLNRTADGSYTIDIERKSLSFSEAIQYQEFMYELIRAVELGNVRFDPNKLGPAQ